MLEIKKITKIYKEFAIKDFSINVEKGDYFMILGVSGAGKSLLLELIAGLIKPDSGTIVFEGEDITNKNIHHRKIGLLFQDYAIFPHLSVKDNIAYPLRLKKLSSAERNKRVLEYAEKVSISHLIHRDPSTLSGGELQRVALARILAMEPDCLLLDEPLSSLDVQLKEGLRTLLRKLNREGLTIIHITHDFEETISLANRLAVIHDGTIVQQGTPKEVFQYPGNEFVAKMTGIKNFFKTKLIKEPPGNNVTALINENIKINLLSEEQNCEGHILIRRRDIIISESKLQSSACNNFEGIITETIPQNTGIEVIINIGVEFFVLLTELSFEELKLGEGKKVWISFKASSVRFIKN